MKQHLRSSTHSPHQKGQKRLVITIVAVLAILALSLLVLFGRQFVGQAISIPSSVTIGETLPINIQPKEETISASLAVTIPNPEYFDVDCDALKTSIEDEINSRFTKTDPVLGDLSLIILNDVAVTCKSGEPIQVDVRFAGLCDDNNCSNRILTHQDVVDLSLTTTAAGTSTIDVDFTPVGLATGNFLAESSSTPVTIVAAAPTDAEGDGIADTLDNCPAVNNPRQEDTDGDGFGDACDLCSAISDPTQPNYDGDTAGDLCDSCPYDSSVQNGECYQCPESYPHFLNEGEAVNRFISTPLHGRVVTQPLYAYNFADPRPSQVKFFWDKDPTGSTANQIEINDPWDVAGSFGGGSPKSFPIANAPYLPNGYHTFVSEATIVGNPARMCDAFCIGFDHDDDGDSYCDRFDTCPLMPNADQADGDNDDVGNVCDNCPAVANTNQADFNGDNIGDACPVCGNKVTEPSEGCDDSNSAGGDGCSASCQVESGWSCWFDAGLGYSVCNTCGDGNILQDETCDDNNLVSGDGCSAVCTIETGWDCPTAGSSCVEDCGDGREVGAELDAGRCDDGNVIETDYCSTTTCIEIGFCGDTIVQSDASEECDDDNTVSGDGCSAICDVESGWDCVTPGSLCEEHCGDGQIVGSETCDDDNKVGGDGCSSTCTVERGYTCSDAVSSCGTACGDGIIVAATEECDDGNTMSDDGCSAVACDVEPFWGCQGEPSTCNAICGDKNIVVGEEVCDSNTQLCAIGDYTGTETCNAQCEGWGSCVADESCGDGNTQSAAGETCDWGATATTDRNGDGILDKNGDECMPGYESTCPYCSLGCKWVSVVSNEVCGDRQLNGPEQCDDGNSVSGDGCSGTELEDSTQHCRIENLDGDTYPALTGVTIVNPAGNQLDCDDTDNSWGGQVTYIDYNTCNDVTECIPPTSIQAAPDEKCNTRDDDCNGFTDADDPNLEDAPPKKYEGVCADSIQVCQSGIWKDPDFSTLVSDYEETTEASCDGLDNDCDGPADEDDGVKTTYYYDADQDGKAGSTTGLFCLGTQPSRYYLANEDCDDNNPQRFDGNSEMCDGIDNDCDADGSVDEGVKTTYYFDRDGDGYAGDEEAFFCPQFKPENYHAESTDCVDNSALNPDANLINPGAAETCDGRDNNCAGGVDEGGVCPGVPFYCDDDGDRYLSSQTNPAYYQDHVTCDQSLLDATNRGCSCSVGNDCDDGDRTSNPNGNEICDEKDNDCDYDRDLDTDDDRLNDDNSGGIDEGLTMIDYYPDVDKDGQGDKYADPFPACQNSNGVSMNNFDCDDTNSARYTGAPELDNGIDDDCDLDTDEGHDNDRDGVPNFFDCDPNDPDNFPGNEEICDGDNNGVGKDNNCQGGANEGGVCATTYYCDADRDWSFSLTVSGTCDAYQCELTECGPGILGDTSPGGDCADDPTADENAAQRTPGKPEVCDDGIDNDCSGTADCSDLSCGDSIQCINSDGDDYVTYLDCDDRNAEVYQSVDGYIDQDGDTYGQGAYVNLCTDEVVIVDASGDCNDQNSLIHPDATEMCDGIDSNCNGMVDEGYSTYYYDADKDLYGDALSTTQACSDSVPDNYVSDIEPGYCLLDGGMNPGLVEDASSPTGCDGKDNDCNGNVDGFCKPTDYFCDDDGDGSFSSSPSGSCSTNDCVRENCVRTQGTDCYDIIDDDPDGCPRMSSDCTEDTSLCAICRYPGAAEICDNIDNNCNSREDESATTRYYLDSDLDGHGSVGAIADACSAPGGYVANDDDCDDDNTSAYLREPLYKDLDGDGYSSFQEEVCHGVDVPAGYSLTTLGDDCNEGNPDIHIEERYHLDLDDDGYGVGDGEVFCPDSLDNYVKNQGGDCDDTDRGVNPGIVENSDDQCDGLDNDCDYNLTLDVDADGINDDLSGGIDEGLTSTYFPDEDDDDYGNPSRPKDACSPPDDYVANALDCQPLVKAINPDAAEICDGRDNDCDDPGDGSGRDEEDVCSADTYFCDSDGDGELSMAISDSGASLPNNCVRSDTTIARLDCNDADITINTTADEFCGDGIDNNCDGQEDEGLLMTYYLDNDGDGHAGSFTTRQYCVDADPDTIPSNYYPLSDDCNDNAFGIYAEVPAYDDNDGDRFGAGDLREVCPAVVVRAIGEIILPTGYSSTNTDCNDADETRWNEVSLFIDADGDSFGSTTTSLECIGSTIPTGFSESNDDCLDDPADANAFATHPGAAENSATPCDGLDNDCDGSVDEGLMSRYYPDTDGDSYGDISSAGELRCLAGDHVSDNTDCNDDNSGISPGAAESCNTVDDDCDGTVDELNGGVAVCLPIDYYCDQDGDTYYSASPSDQVQGETCTAGLLPAGCQCEQGDDCRDTNDEVNPGVLSESCNGIDDNCDARVDEGNICSEKDYYCDADGDDEISATVTDQVSFFECTARALTDARILDCSCTAGLDCQDGDDSITSTSTEDCDDGINNDCTDARVDCEDPACSLDTSCGDEDGDGSLVTEDCNDADDTIYPSAPEICDGLDNDCDTDADEGFPNDDGDTFGNSCDPCLNDPLNDADGDTFCGNIDICELGYDSVDDDDDGVPNACDSCPATPRGLPAITTIDDPQRGCVDPFLTYLMTRLGELTENPPVQEKIKFLADVGKRIKER